MRSRLSAAPVFAIAALLVLGSGLAAADPEPTLPDPAVIDPAAADAAPPAPVDPFVAASEATKSNPTGFLTELLGPGGTSAGAGIGLSEPSPVDPLAAGWELLLPNNYRMPAGDNPYVLQSGVAPGPFARVNAFKGQHAIAHGGMGRMPGSELGIPLPGTAPLPGSNVPAGLEQFYVPPAAPADTPPPVPVIPPVG